MSASAPEVLVTPGLSAARLDELVDKTEEAMNTLVELLHDALSEDGHTTSHRPEGGQGNCRVCDLPWTCPVADTVMKATHGIKKAPLALGCDRDVIENQGWRHRPRAAS